MGEADDLFSAVKRGDIDAVRRFFSVKAGWLARLFSTTPSVNTRRNSDGKEPLHYAVENDKAAMVAFLLDAGAKVNARDDVLRTPLHTAACHDSREVLPALLKAGADVHAKDQWGDTPLHSAAARGHAEIASALLDAGADISAKGEKDRTPLHCVCQSRNVALFRMLRERGADLGKENLTALVTAALSDSDGEFELAGELIDLGGKDILNACDEEAPLLHAAKWHELNSVQWLLDKGADPAVRDPAGNNALHHVAQGAIFAFTKSMILGGCPPIVEVTCRLIQAGVPVDDKNKEGMSPIDVFKAAPELVARVAAAAQQHSDRVLDFTQPITGVVGAIAAAQALLDSCHGQPSIVQLVSDAIKGGMSRQIPIVMIPPVVTHTLDAMHKENPSLPVQDLVQQVAGGFSFACPACGPIDSDKVYLAVAARWMKDINPEMGITFWGKNAASLYGGWCPECGSLTANVSFGPASAQVPIPRAVNETCSEQGPLPKPIVVSPPS